MKYLGIETSIKKLGRKVYDHTLKVTISDLFTLSSVVSVCAAQITDWFRDWWSI